MNVMSWCLFSHVTFETRNKHRNSIPCAKTTDSASVLGVVSNKIPMRVMASSFAVDARAWCSACRSSKYPPHRHTSTSGVSYAPLDTSHAFLLSTLSASISSSSSIITPAFVVVSSHRSAVDFRAATVSWLQGASSALATVSYVQPWWNKHGDWHRIVHPRGHTQSSVLYPT